MHDNTCDMNINIILLCKAKIQYLLAYMESGLILNFVFFTTVKSNVKTNCFGHFYMILILKGNSCFCLLYASVVGPQINYLKYNYII